MYVYTRARDCVQFLCSICTRTCVYAQESKQEQGSTTRMKVGTGQDDTDSDTRAAGTSTPLLVPEAVPSGLPHCFLGSTASSQPHLHLDVGLGDPLTPHLKSSADGCGDTEKMPYAQGRGSRGGGRGGRRRAKGKLTMPKKRRQGVKVQARPDCVKAAAQGVEDNVLDAIETSAEVPQGQRARLKASPTFSIRAGGADEQAEEADQKTAVLQGQSAHKGIVEMRQMVNRLMRRIHYAAFKCPSKETWRLFHKAVDRCSTAAEVRVLGRQFVCACLCVFVCRCVKSMQAYSYIHTRIHINRWETSWRGRHSNSCRTCCGLLGSLVSRIGRRAVSPARCKQQNMCLQMCACIQSCKQRLDTRSALPALSAYTANTPTHADEHTHTHTLIHSHTHTGQKRAAAAQN